MKVEHLNPINNLNFIRLICAAIIAYQHLTALSVDPELYENSIRNKFLYLMSGTALSVFFLLSGYLLVRSALNYNFKKYMIKRLRRIYPVFLASLFLIAFVYYPLMCAIDNKNYRLSSGLFFLVKNIFIYPFRSSIEGTLDDNFRSNLWSANNYALFYEFVLYFILYISIRYVNKNRLLLLISLFLSLHSVLIFFEIIYFESIANFFKFAALFFFGTYLRLFQDKKEIIHIFLFCSLVGYCFDEFEIISSIILFYYILKFKYRLPNISKFTTLNDFSYGIYIYRWPTIQFVIAVQIAFNVFNFVLISIYSILIVCFLVVISFYFIEKRFYLRRV